MPRPLSLRSEPNVYMILVINYNLHEKTMGLFTCMILHQKEYHQMITIDPFCTLFNLMLTNCQFLFFSLKKIKRMFQKTITFFHAALHS